jgi:hypothetical protein
MQLMPNTDNLDGLRCTGAVKRVINITQTWDAHFDFELTLKHWQ